MADYSYAAALEILNGLDTTQTDAKTRHQLKATALLVEGKRNEGLAEITRFLKAKGSEEEAAGILFQAAAVMLREKNRVNEAIELLDLIVRDYPGQTRMVIDLAWDRALEYLVVRGDGGYRLMDFVIRRDPQSLGRLKAFNSIFARRWEDMQMVESRVKTWNERLQEFQSANRRPPVNISELASWNRDMPDDTTKAGWDYQLARIDNAPSIIATAQMKHPLGIPWGTQISINTK